MTSIHDYQSWEAWERVKHLPVNRFGYKHIDNIPNQAFRNGELEAWKAAYNGESKRMIDLSWKFSARLLMKPYAQLNKLSESYKC